MRLKFIEYCKKEKINSFKLKNNEKEKLSQVSIEELDIDINKVKLGKGLNLKKPEELSRSEFANKITKIFYERYPEFNKYQKLADEINEKYYCNERDQSFKLKFRLKFHWDSKYTKVNKISLRCTNSYCNKSKKERDSIIKEYGLWLEADVKSSVPRLNLSINKGKWVGGEQDLYKEIFECCYPGQEFKKEEREALKKIFLRAYFEDSVGLLNRDVWNNMDKVGIEKHKVKEALELLDKAIKKVLGGKIYGTEIYYFEGCVYLRVLKRLLENGLKVWLLYDGFYSSGEADLWFDYQVDWIIEEEFNKFLKEYIDNRVDREK